MEELEDILTIDQIGENVQDISDNISALKELLSDLKTNTEEQTLILQDIRTNTSNSLVCELWISTLIGFLIGVGLMLIFKK